MPPWQQKGDQHLGKAGKTARWEVRQAAERRQAAQQPSRSGVWSMEEEEGEGSFAAIGGKEPVSLSPGSLPPTCRRSRRCSTAPGAGCSPRTLSRSGTH